MDNFEFKSNAKIFKEAKDEAVQRGLIAIGMAIEGYAKMKTPVGTPESTGIPGYMGGTLRNSISYATKKHKGKTIKVTKEESQATKANHGGKKMDFANDEDDSVLIGTNVFYAPYVEMGTSKTKAQPFLKPAITDHMQEFKGLILTELKKG